jgi:ABC-2 type transport system permease protein
MKLDLFEPIAVALATGALCMLCSTYMISSCSISIEGKNIDALKSLPLESQTVLESKLLFHYIFPGIIMLVGSVLTGILFKVKPLSFVSLILIPQLYLVVTDMMGLYFNLLFPKMDWANEEAVVKRGISVLLSMLTGMALIGLAVGAYFLFLDEYLVLEVYLLVVAGVLLLLAVGLYFLLMTNGVKRFEKIHKGV